MAEIPQTANIPNILTRTPSEFAALQELATELKNPALIIPRFATLGQRAHGEIWGKFLQLFMMEVQVALVGGLAGGWVDDGAIVRLATAADAVSIGIATLAGTEKVRVLNGAVLFDGTTGAVPVAGAGTRMMWVPAKKAWRAGDVSGTQWDDASVGMNSFAHGIDTIASGLVSSAHGNVVSATAANARVTGNRAIANRLGGQTHANGRFAFLGDAQTTTIELRRESVDATLVELTKDGTAPTGTTLPTSNRIILEIKHHYHFHIAISGLDIDGYTAGSAAGEAWGRCHHANDGTITVVTASLTVNSSGSSAVSISADATNKSLKIEVAGGAGDAQYRWHARVTLVELENAETGE